jgi:hypothetical protein
MSMISVEYALKSSEYRFDGVVRYASLRNISLYKRNSSIK